MIVPRPGFSLLGSCLLLLAACPAPDDRLADGGRDPHDGDPRADARRDGPGPDGEELDAEELDAATPHDAAPPDAEAPDAEPPDAALPLDVTVCASGGDYATIGAALAAVTPGSTVTVCAGTYHERFTLDAMPVTLIGAAGAAATILDGDHAGTVITVRNTGGTGVSIRGFTIQHGASVGSGGGLRCEGSALTLTDSTLTSNTAEGGGGLYATGCALAISNAAFYYNTGGTTGGGAWLVDSTGVFGSNDVAANNATYGGGLATKEGTVSVQSNTLHDNTAFRGGGLYHDSAGPITANVVSNNTAGWTGGGIHTVAHVQTLVSNTVRANISDNDGGGVYMHQAVGIVRGNHILENHGGDDGGGLRVFESALLIEANLIENNHADDSGGGIRSSHVPSTLIDNIVRGNLAGGTGGGMDLDNDASTVRGGEITDNRAYGSGGGIFSWLNPWTGLVIEDVLIARNRAWQGAGIYLIDNFTPVTIRGVQFIGNRAGRGGGLYVRSTNYTLTNSVFIGNNASERGGALFAREVPEWADPSDPDPCPCPPTNPIGQFDFVVMAGNTSPNGAAVWTNASGLSIENSILFDIPDTTGTSIVAEGTELDPMVPVPPSLAYNDLFGATFLGMEDPTGRDGNIAADPLFVDLANGDVHLATGSACIDAADPQLLDPDGSRADMGAFGGSL